MQRNFPNETPLKKRSEIEFYPSGKKISTLSNPGGRETARTYHWAKVETTGITVEKRVKMGVTTHEKKSSNKKKGITNGKKAGHGRRGGLGSGQNNEIPNTEKR